MKSPKGQSGPPAPPPVPPPVAAVPGIDPGKRADNAKRKKEDYSLDKTIFRSGGLSAMPAGTSPTLGA